MVIDAIVAREWLVEMMKRLCDSCVSSGSSINVRRL
jgi:hypothetical protein